MIALLLSAFFAASGLLAAAVIGTGGRRYVSALHSLRAELAACEPTREVRMRISALEVRRSATVLRPRFTAAARHPSPPAALPFAA